MVKQKHPRQMNTSTTFQIGQTVEHRTFGTGTVIAQDAANTTVDFGGTIGTKVLITRFAFGTIAAEVKAPKMNKAYARRQREEARYATLTNMQRLQQFIGAINATVQGDRHSQALAVVVELLDRVEEVATKQGETFVTDVINTVVRTMRASDKQINVIASFADRNNINA